jgi:hypothetical protein
MSLCWIDPTDDGLRILSMYDAPDDWSVEPVDQRDQLIAPLCEHSEGAGCWLGYNPDTGVWGILLRRDDTPYNDCLPPSETILREGLKQPDLASAEEHLVNQFERGFYNESNVILGDKSINSLRLLNCGFQVSASGLDPSSLLLADNLGVNETPWDGEPEAKEVPRFDDFQDMVNNDRAPNLSSKGGMRQTRAAICLEMGDGILDVCQVLGYPPDSDWNKDQFSIQ